MKNQKRVRRVDLRCGLVLGIRDWVLGDVGGFVLYDTGFIDTILLHYPEYQSRSISLYC